MTTPVFTAENPGPSGLVYAAADRLLAERGHSFHWARRLLTSVHARRATRLYGFCRHIDDLADGVTDPTDADEVAAARVALAVIRQALLTGGCDDHQTTDMLQLMQVCAIDPAVVRDLLRGVEGDLGEVRVADMDELLRYGYQVAGTVGVMMTAALDVYQPEALPHAIDLGIAMQLTNICRDVREDALMGRRYLPSTLVGRLEPAELIDPTPAVRVLATRAIRLLLDTADRRYASGELGLRYLPAGARAGILVAARVYRGIGTVLRERGFDCWSSRAHVGTLGKTALTLRALAALVCSQASGTVRRAWPMSNGAPPNFSSVARSAENGVAD